LNRIFQEKEAVLCIDGAAGRLELKVNGLTAALVAQGVAVICHPHPLYRGTFDNKVCSTLARGFCEAGFIAVRFNFRGVGASEGSWREGIGEIEDLRAVVNWVQQQEPGLPISLAGFSFGGAIAAAYARDHAGHLQRLILVSPAFGHYGFELDDALQLPVLITQGEVDEILPPELVYRWVQESSNDAVILVRFADTGHFYHGRLTELKKALLDFLSA